MSENLTKDNFEAKVRNFYKEISEGSGKPNLQCEYMMTLLNFKIDLVESKSKKSKYINYVLKISILLLAGLSTIILGLKSEVFSFSESWKIQPADIALIFSAAITFISGLAAFWDIENYQMRTKIMLNRLKELRYKFTLEATGENKLRARELDKIMEEFLNIVGDGYWERKFLQRLDQEKKIVPNIKEDNKD